MRCVRAMRNCVPSSPKTSVLRPKRGAVGCVRLPVFALSDDEDRRVTEDERGPMVSDPEPLSEAKRLAELGDRGAYVLIHELRSNRAGWHRAVRDQVTHRIERRIARLT